MAKFHSLAVKDIRRETDDCVSIAFHVPSDLQAEYTFIQGQYLTLKTLIKGEDVRRSYSICASPAEGELRVAIKLLENGLFSTYANTQLKVGDKLDVMTPMGNFYTELDAHNRKQYVAFAAGSGITPIMAILKTVLLQEPHSQFTLVYGNKNRNSIIFLEELIALKNKYIERLSVYHILSREMSDSPFFEGRIDSKKCQSLFKNIIPAESIDTFYLCGPEAMVLDVTKTLESINIPKKNIHFELFNTSNKGVKSEALIPTNVGESCKVRVRLDDTTFDMEMKFGTDSVLDAALKQGADLPFACKGGVCCTCRAKLISGKVEMKVNYSLEPDEVERGYILTCQSYPLTDSIEVDFDVR